MEFRLLKLEIKSEENQSIGVENGRNEKRNAFLECFSQVFKAVALTWKRRKTEAKSGQKQGTQQQITGR